jgi:hypothetical protein
MVSAADPSLSAKVGTNITDKLRSVCIILSLTQTTEFFSFFVLLHVTSG